MMAHWFFLLAGVSLGLANEMDLARRIVASSAARQPTDCSFWYPKLNSRGVREQLCPTALPARHSSLVTRHWSFGGLRDGKNAMPLTRTLSGSLMSRVVAAARRSWFRLVPSGAGLYVGQCKQESGRPSKHEARFLRCNCRRRSTAAI
jgi:hypothetical protein